MIREAIERNRPCHCGSGLKLKKCHGDKSKVETCARLARLMFGRLVTESRYKAKLIEAEEHDRIVSACNTTMAEMIFGPEAEAEPQPQVEEKRTLSDLQNGLSRCPKCGGMVPAGTKCVKCGEVVG